MAGRHRIGTERSELYANTVAVWLWSQGTLIASALTVPLLTRFLSQEEYGLWTQLLSMSALAAAADMGMSLVFLRRLTDCTDPWRLSAARSAAVFYRTSTAILTAVLLLSCLLPDGVLSPYQAHAVMPVQAALAVIAAIAVNLRCQTSALRLRARGRMDLAQVFGAGPAVTGSIATVLAAYWFGTAVAVAFTYAAVEIAFDIVLVLVAHRHCPASSATAPVPGRKFMWWARLWYESTGILVVDIAPTVSVLIGVTVVGHVAGAATVALFGVAARVGSLVQRFVTPLTESLYVSLCRAEANAARVVTGLVARLSAVALGVGIASAFAVVAAGPLGMRLIFGDHYGAAVWAALVMILAETVRSICRPFLRRTQSDNGMGGLRFWFAASMVAQIPIALFCAARWSSAGVAAAVLVCAVFFEAVPVAVKLGVGRHLLGSPPKTAIIQIPALLSVTCLPLLLAWSRSRFGAATAGVAAVGALTTGLLVLGRVFRYLGIARLMRGSSLIPIQERNYDRSAATPNGAIPSLGVQQSE